MHLAPKQQPVVTPIELYFSYLLLLQIIKKTSLLQSKRLKVSHVHMLMKPVKTSKREVLEIEFQAVAHLNLPTATLGTQVHHEN